MTLWEITDSYITQRELVRAYRQLDHTPPPTDDWTATLIITAGLRLRWACPVLTDAGEQDWHIIAEAGELAWPPLRDEEALWADLLARHPVPTDERSQAAARLYGQSVPEMHYEQLRQHYLTEAYIGPSKRNPTDVNFDPIVRDWTVVARALVAFLDAHKPPKLTAQQRVMARGAAVAELEQRLDTLRTGLADLMRNTDPGQRSKTDLARWSGLSRPTVDAWLAAEQTHHAEGAHGA